MTKNNQQASVQNLSDTSSLDPKVQQRLRLLKRAEELGNIVQACEEMGIPRTLFYRYRKRYEQHGLAGLEDRPPVHKSHPQTKPPEVVEKILELAVRYPQATWAALERELSDRGLDCSWMTVRSILDKNQMDSSERERQHLERWPTKSPVDPRSRWKVPPQAELYPWELDTPFGAAERPGQRLCQFVFLLRRCGALGGVYVHAVVDTYNSMAWARVARKKVVGEALDLLESEVLRFYRQHHLKVDEIKTQNSSLFKRPPLSSLEEKAKWDDNLAANMKAQKAGLEKRVQKWKEAPEDDWRAKRNLANYQQARLRERSDGWFIYQEVLKGRNISFDAFAFKNPDALWEEQIRGAGFNDFALLFHQILRYEFFTPAQRDATGQTLQSLQLDLDAYLRFYNLERPHSGYPNFDQTPAQRLTSYMSERRT